MYSVLQSIAVLQSSNLSLAKDTWLILIHQLARAISYLHDQGFIHQDIKADNVLVSYLNQEYHAILIDFGKCTASTASGSLIKHLTPEEEEKYKRKHAHIAPEIINGSHPPSFASDVLLLYCECSWSKKCMWFPLCSGEKAHPEWCQVKTKTNTNHRATSVKISMAVQVIHILKLTQSFW